MTDAMTDAKKGDRVRVVIEGTVTYSDFGKLAVGADGGQQTLHTVLTSHPSVVSVEVLARQFKVGDTVEGDDYAKLPVGTVVKHDGHRNVRVKVLGGTWIDPTSPTDYRLNTCFENARKIVFLP